MKTDSCCEQWEKSVTAIDRFLAEMALVRQRNVEVDQFVYCPYCGCNRKDFMEGYKLNRELSESLKKAIEEDHVNFLDTWSKNFIEGQRLLTPEERQLIDSYFWDLVMTSEKEAQQEFSENIKKHLAEPSKLTEEQREYISKLEQEFFRKLDEKGLLANKDLLKN